MSNELAREPNDLARFFVDRANAGDLDGIVALFEPDAVVTSPSDIDIVGHKAIHAEYAAVLARHPRFGLAISSRP